MESKKPNEVIICITETVGIYTNMGYIPTQKQTNQNYCKIYLDMTSILEKNQKTSDKKLK